MRHVRDVGVVPGCTVVSSTSLSGDLAVAVQATDSIPPRLQHVSSGRSCRALHGQAQLNAQDSMSTVGHLHACHVP